MKKTKRSDAPLTSGLITEGLGTRTFGRSVLCLPRTTSTNDVALELARVGAPEGTVVAAEVQTKGRGRHGRKWVLTEGKGLAFSVILRPKLHVDEVAEITLAAAVAVARTLEGHRMKPRIKWPNDVLLSGKKVCGILTEMGPKKDKALCAVLGVGMNLNQTRDDLPLDLRATAGSLLLASGRMTDRVRFFQSLLLELEETYRWVAERRFSKVLQEWRKRSVTLGAQLRVTQPGRSFFGQGVDVDEKGALLVRNDQGFTEKVTSGEVDLLPLKRGKK